MVSFPTFLTAVARHESVGVSFSLLCLPLVEEEQQCGRLGKRSFQFVRVREEGGSGGESRAARSSVCDTPAAVPARDSGRESLAAGLSWSVHVRIYRAPGRRRTVGEEASQSAECPCLSAPGGFCALVLLENCFSSQCPGSAGAWWHQVCSLGFDWLNER